MLKWFNTSPLFEEEDGASGTATLAPGDPFEHDTADVEDDEPEVVESASDKELKAVKAELAEERRKRTESEADARHWATQARRPAAPTVASEPVVEDKAEDLDEDPSVFLDGLSTKGAKLLKEKGFITKADLKEVIAELRADTDNKISGTVKATKLDALMAEEFPELIADSVKVDNAKKSGTRAEVSQLFQRTTEIYNEAIESNSALAGSPEIMLIAARQARAELKGKPKEKATEPEVHVDSRPQSRRSRIESARPARDVRDDDRGGGRSEMTAQQREVAKRLGVSEGDFQSQQAKIERTRRRG